MEFSLSHPVNCLCHNLRSASRKITLVYDDAMRSVGIRATQFSLLATIDGVGGENLATVTKLADQMGMDRTTLTRNLAVAEAQKWVTIRQGSDLRERVITLTPAGRRKLQEAMPLWKSAQKRVVEKLGKGNIQELLIIARSIRTD